MRFFILLSLCCCFTGSVSAQAVYNVREVLTVPGGVPAFGGTVYARLPLTSGGQVVSEEMFSITPQGSPAEGYRWAVDELVKGDSLRFSYRVLVAPIPAWNSDSLSGRTDLSVAWIPARDGIDAGPYILPPLVREEAARTDLRTLSAGDTSLRDIDQLIRRMDRRVKTISSFDRFDYSQPLLQDLYLRQTTPQRKPLLLSLALQYIDVPHRVVAGKVLSYGEVRENELWVEIPVGNRWYRVYYGDGTDRSDWLPPDEPDQFLACAYDWRALTLEVVSTPGNPPVATTLTGRYDNLFVEFWMAKDKALGRKRYGQAVGYLDSMLTYMPRSVIAISEIGLVYTQAGRPEDGGKYLNQAMEIARGDIDRGTAYLQLAKYYSMLREVDKSIQAIAQAFLLVDFDLRVIYTDSRFEFLSKQPKIDYRLRTTIEALQAGY